MNRLKARLPLTLSAFLLLAPFLSPSTLFAQKKSAPAPKAAPAPKSAPAAKPSGGTKAATTGTKAAGSSTITAGSRGGTTGAAAKAPITTAGAHSTPTITAANKAAASASPLHVQPIAGLRPAGATVRGAPNGSSVVMRANGRPADMHDAARGMDIHHNLAGGARIDARRPDGTRVSIDRGRRSFVEHSFRHGDHEFGRRSYYYHGRYYDRYYSHYGYRGLYLDVYSPYRYYPFGFYGWAYNPWAAPVYYSWGFGPAPWYGYYGSYWTPAPVYATPSAWVTDYVVSSSLADAYDARTANQSLSEAAGNAPPAPMTPQVKQLVSQEVQGQIALENAEAQGNASGHDPDPGQGSIERLLGDGQSHVFVPGKELDLVDATGQECPVTEGDILQLSGQQDPNAQTAQLIVLASKGGAECRGGATVTVPLAELQEMQNNMRERVDQGLAELQAKQGTHGLPPAPPSALSAPIPAQMAQAAPPPDPAVAQELAQQATAAAQSEKDVLAQTQGVGGPNADTSGLSATPPPQAPPANIALGQTIAEVTGSLGQPLRIMNLGPKTVYVYQDMKIIFRAGKVADVQ